MAWRGCRSGDTGTGFHQNVLPKGPVQTAGSTAPKKNPGKTTVRAGPRVTVNPCSEPLGLLPTQHQQASSLYLDPETSAQWPAGSECQAGRPRIPVPGQRRLGFVQALTGGNGDRHFCFSQVFLHPRCLAAEQGPELVQVHLYRLLSCIGPGHPAVSGAQKPHCGTYEENLCDGLHMLDPGSCTTRRCGLVGVGRGLPSCLKSVSS